LGQVPDKVNRAVFEPLSLIVMKIICVGRNYSEHIEELGNARPDTPVIFLKPDTALLQVGQPFYIPDFSSEIHYEVEVLVKVNRVGKHIDKKFAHKYYEEIGLGIDFTARDLQEDLKSKGLPWERAKAFDGSAVVGTWISKKNFDDLQHLNFSLMRNGSSVQMGNTAQMLWKIDELIEYISKYFTLKTGDIIFTGTPSGVGRVETGDELTGFIEDNEMFKLTIK